ncbi:hypothetical protein [Microbulbifer halophilus]|uniref:Uncharacterized protein n=1 Tax=Microbulbifer halophilus TaxID=453963 RepID=A0ABW5EGV3_9GAMM|nr:hypothetical protein [Microbulbifer halophilus]MCW8128221.1 hypothetical protein [Microbulbifer halophilus]
MSKKMGAYCKGYQLKHLRAFSDWKEDAEAARPSVEGGAPRSLGDEDVVYVQEDLSVTDGIFLEEHVIFSGEGDAWTEFCKKELRFEIPDDVQRASQLEAG